MHPARAQIVGYTIGDVSSRDIEGENPLYLHRRRSTTVLRWVNGLANNEPLRPTGDRAACLARSAIVAKVTTTFSRQMRRDARGSWVPLRERPFDRLRTSRARASLPDVTLQPGDEI
jgi:hypothetical protein